MEILSLNTNSLNQNNYNKINLTPEFIGSLIIYPVNCVPQKYLLGAELCMELVLVVVLQGIKQAQLV